MSYEIIYKGSDISIEKIFDGIILSAVVDGRNQEITLKGRTDMDVLYSLLGDILSREYASSQIRGPLDYDLEGC